MIKKSTSNKIAISTTLAGIGSGVGIGYLIFNNGGHNVSQVVKEIQEQEIIATIEPITGNEIPEEIKIGPVGLEGSEISQGIGYIEQPTPNKTPEKVKPVETVEIGEIQAADSFWVMQEVTSAVITPITTVKPAGRQSFKMDIDPNKAGPIKTKEEFNKDLSANKSSLLGWRDARTACLFRYDHLTGELKKHKDSECQKFPTDKPK